MQAVIAAAPTAPTAPTSTGEPAGELQPPKQYVRKPALPAITGLRTLLAITIILFHFTPNGLTWSRHPSITLYPLINIGFVFVSFFFLISGSFLRITTRGGRADERGGLLGGAVFAALPGVCADDGDLDSDADGGVGVRSRTEFWMGAIATPLLVQGFFPHLATFWMTVTWTLSCEVMLYLAFPWLLKLPWPRSTGKLLALGFSSGWWD
jgi:peptidoglycan/LPS O-acetylase OafA/YrhL